MGLFNFRKNSELDSIRQELTAQVEELKNQVLRQFSYYDLDISKLQSHITSLRGLVNRKLNGEIEQQEKPKVEQQEKPQTESINTHYY